MLGAHIADIAAKTSEYAAHLHFMYRDADGALRNPSKFVAAYDAADAHICVQELILDRSIRDGAMIAEECDVGVGSALNPIDDLCRSYG